MRLELMHAPRMAWTTILVPYDFSESAEHATEIAAMEARVHRARLVLIHVVELLPHFGHETTLMVRPGTNTPVSVLRYYVETAETELAERAARLRADGIEVDLVVRSGVPVEEIRGYLIDHPVSVIVMGTHGRTGMRRLLAGSLAERLVRVSPVPVLTIRHPDSPTI